jgi:N-acyl-D-amino-acid deacylase
MKYLLLFFLISPFISFSQVMPDLIITNGRVVDGTGNSWFRADIAIKGDKIFQVVKGLKNPPHQNT